MKATLTQKKDALVRMRPQTTGGPRRAPPTAYDRIMSSRISSGMYPSQTHFESPENPPTFLPPIQTPELRSLAHSTSKSISPIELSYQPENMICPSCRKIILTSTSSSTSRFSVLLSAWLCLLGCWCCVCLPACLDSLKTVKHNCPKCKTLIGIYDPHI